MGVARSECNGKALRFTSFPFAKLLTFGKHLSRWYHGIIFHLISASHYVKNDVET